MARDYSILHSLHGAVPESVVATFQLVLSHLYDLNDQVQGMPRNPKSLSISDIESQIQARKTIDLTQFLGVLAQPQNAAIPEVSALPSVNDPLAQNGGAVRLNGVLYIFDGDPEPGTWVAVTAAGVIRDTAANMATYSAAAYPNVFFYQTDRTVLYLSDGTNWIYADGMMTAAIASRPGALGGNDARFLFYSTDTFITYLWSGAAWVAIASYPVILTADVTGILPIGNGGTGVSYNRIAASLAFQNQVATLGPTTIASVGSQFLFTYNLFITTIDGGAATVQVSVSYTDDNGATTQVGVALAVTALNRDTGSFVIYRFSGNLQYTVTVTGAIGTAQFAFYATLQRFS